MSDDTAQVANGRMSTERLAEIRACAENYNGLLVQERPNSAIAHRAELLAELERLGREQQPAEATGGEQVQDGAVGRVRATLDRHAARGSSGGEYDDADIRAVLDNREAWRNLAKSRGAERDALAARVAELEARPRIEIKPGRELTDDEVQALTDRFTMPAGRVVFLDADPTKES